MACWRLFIILRRTVDRLDEDFALEWTARRVNDKKCWSMVEIIENSFTNLSLIVIGDWHKIDSNIWCESLCITIFLMTIFTLKSTLTR